MATIELEPMQLSGEVFEMGGKVAGCIPATGKPGAIRFDIQRREPATDKSPGWCHMMVFAGLVAIPVKIKSDTCEAPYFRLFDCVAMIGQHFKKIHQLEPRQAIRREFGVTGATETYVFWWEPLGGQRIIMADTAKRMRDWGGSVGTKPCSKLSDQDRQQRRRKKLERQRKKANRPR